MKRRRGGETPIVYPPKADNCVASWQIYPPKLSSRRSLGEAQVSEGGRALYLNCPSVGTGRQDGLKIHWPQGRESSNLSSGTFILFTARRSGRGPPALTSLRQCRAGKIQWW